jgi:hypothetical protein
MAQSNKAYYNAADIAVVEALKAKRRFPADFTSVHEGYAVILEEMDELWIECKRKVINRDDLRKEAIQCAAMCLRFIAELT